MNKILVTGGSGSLGTALIKYLLKQPTIEKIVAFARSETGLADLADRLNHPQKLQTMLGDVRDLDRVQEAMCRVDTVIHAAALKRLDAVNHDPLEIMKTNFLGTVNVVRAAALRQVPRVLVISTDKAASPSTRYGLSKAIAEEYAVHANHLGYPRSRIAVARWGNVLGSRGSVVHVWRRQLAAGLPLTLTDERMSRFLLTMDQAVAFVLQALDRMHGGEILIPRLPAVQLVALAEAMAPGAPVKVVGLRGSGEKLAEVLLSADESPRALYDPLGDCYVLEPGFHSWPYQPWQGERLPDGFRYSSLDAPRLSIEQMRTMLTEGP